MLRIEPLPNGRVKLVKDYKDPLTGKRKRLSKTVDKATRQVQKQVELLLDQRFEKEIELSKLADGNVRFSDLVAEFLAKRKTQVKPSTYYIQQGYFRELIELVGSQTLVRNITTQLLRRIFEDLIYKQKMSNKAVQERLSIARLVMRHAVHAGYISENPTPSGKEIEWRRISEAPTNVAEKFLDDDEVTAVLEYLRANYPIVADFCEWQYLTGMRFGEAASIQIKDVTFADGQYSAEVNGTLDYNGKRVAELRKSDSPKTLSSFRTIALPEKAVAIYKQHAEGKHDDDFLFTTNDHPLVVGNVDHILAKARRKLGIKKKLTSHVFRHTHISKLAELGVPIYVIQERVGHADEKITKSVYLHVTKNAQKHMDEKLNLL